MQVKPTHTSFARFVSSLLPPKPNDVPLYYHTPRHPNYNPDVAVIDKIVLGVVPTAAVYDDIGYPQMQNGTAQTPNNNLEQRRRRPPRTACFLHRPFTLDRRRVRKGTLVLSSHTSFDENLTVGWNPALAARLGMNIADSLCVQGYKGDPDRKIGIISRMDSFRALLLGQIKQEFGRVEHIHEGGSEDIAVVAIMNAFHAEEVYRVMDVARQQEWISPETGGRDLLYLTGQMRGAGMAAAKELGITVVCVGHLAAEEWGLRYMADCLRAAFPDVLVREALEDEVSTAAT
ncbi:hypothetical protein EJ04DRAFT_530439 [Polyplosphaeria fusca]|uniref:Uncharacterized protein n=1 Tax=Polyplosphaeria fusca TaxID=682080 RepID=A0A9P4RD24_9PLEO|nr:hypothetical protein EJ04DRAFT_530439 [Polyplosphaeria fusca]